MARSSPADRSAPLLEVRGLRVGFETPRGLLRAVDGVDLELRAGETLGLVGESGSGKSVTALSLLDLVPAAGRRAEGEVRFRGEAVQGEALRRLRGVQLGMVFQDARAALNPVLPIGEQVAEMARLHLGMDAGQAARHAAGLLHRVGLPGGDERARSYPHELSGGMCQRVLLAMAVACDPAVLIADEPTTALDVTTQAQILDLIEELQAQAGMGVLLITHDLALVAERAQRVAVLYAGRVVEAGPTEQVFGSPRHPYTRGLLDCVPDLGALRPLVPIPGALPSPYELPAGCRFAPRCARAEGRCRDEDPVLGVAKSGGAMGAKPGADPRTVACHFPLAEGEA